MSHWDSVKRDSHLSIENSYFIAVAEIKIAWIEIPSFIPSKRERRFSYYSWECTNQNSCIPTEKEVLMPLWDSAKIDSHLSIENSRFITENAWIEILGLILWKRELSFSCPLRMCEMWFSPHYWESVNWDSRFPLRQREKGFPSQYWELALHYWECVNLDSRIPAEKAWIEILTSLLRMCESRFLHRGRESVNWDSRQRKKDSHLSIENSCFIINRIEIPHHHWEWWPVNWDSRFTIESTWIKIHAESVN